MLVVGSRNQILSIYDVATRTRLGRISSSLMRRFDGTKGERRPDGNAVAINGRAGLTVWNLESRTWSGGRRMQIGRAQPHPAEWNAYLGNLGAYRTTCPGLPIVRPPSTLAEGRDSVETSRNSGPPPQPETGRIMAQGYQPTS